jgi:hypothetical protein
MAFYDDLARDPKTEKEFWVIIEDTFVQVKGAHTDYLAETRDEALSDALRGDNFKDASLSFIRYRGVAKGVDSRDYFLELGRRFLPEVERQIKARKLTAKFAKDWGVVMMCHGFISAHILDDSDGLDRVRAGLKSADIRNRDAQRKWIAHQILRLLKPGPHRLTRKQADAWLGEQIGRLIENGKFPIGYGRGWFESIMDNGALRDAYSQKRLSTAELRKLVSQPSDAIPPINFSR